MEISLHAVQRCLLSFSYLLLVLLVQALYEEIVLPRLSFSKTSASNLKQMLVRWVLYARRSDFDFWRDSIVLLKISIFLTALAILPIDGSSGLKVDRPDLAIALLMSIFYFLRVFSGWKGSKNANWEKSLEETLFASARIFVFLLIVDGAYLAAGPDQFQNMLGSDWLIVSGPFHAIGFLLGIFLVGFFQGRQEYRQNLDGLSLFAWKSEPILWVTLLLVTFTNTSIAQGAPYFFALAAKCVLTIFLLDLVRSHMPKVRMDQIEQVGLTVIYPLVVLIFLGMWWQGATL